MLYCTSFSDKPILGFRYFLPLYLYHRSNIYIYICVYSLSLLKLPVGISYFSDTPIYHILGYMSIMYSIYPDLWFVLCP